ncbi:hypothetical protein MSPP1_003552 [Malassezia sp. CBS 17886]|nr:hypothetical protein MSPP1_003552 [Malassezia sp. CBS 17886]
MTGLNSAVHGAQTGGRGARAGALDVLVSLYTSVDGPVRVRVDGAGRSGDVAADALAAVPIAAADVARVRLTTRGGSAVPVDARIADLAGDARFVDLEARMRCVGGKGGFGNMLRAQGGRMSVRSKDQNMDSCRDLSGRRLSTVKEAQRLAEYIAKEPERKAAMDEAQKQKYAKLEKMLGREPTTARDFEVAAEKLDESGDALALAERDASAAGPSARKRKERLEDHEFVEQSREIVDNVRGAVALAMAKKKKKKGKGPAAAKAGSGPGAASVKGKGREVASAET